MTRGGGEDAWRDSYDGWTTTEPAPDDERIDRAQVRIQQDIYALRLAIDAFEARWGTAMLAAVLNRLENA